MPQRFSFAVKHGYIELFWLELSNEYAFFLMLFGSALIFLFFWALVNYREISERFALVKACFPETWKRKFLLLWPFFLTAKSVKNGEKLIAICSHLPYSTAIICVKPGYRRRKIAANLIKDKKIFATLVRKNNPAGLAFWKSQGFKIAGSLSIPFYDKYWVVKKSAPKKKPINKPKASI